MVWLHDVKQAGKELAGGLLHLLLPHCCHACGRPLGAQDDAFCDPCKTQLFFGAGLRCSRCAATIGPYADCEDGCRHFRAERFAFDQAICMGPYDGVLRDLVLRLKHAQNEGLAELIGELWAAQSALLFLAQCVEIVVPVPLHWRRRWQRGYNQSAAIARGLAAGLRLPLVTGGLRRVRHTPIQTGRTAPGRRDNLRGAFAAGPASRSFADRTALLVDDVMTSGATVQAAARALRSAGAKRVVVAAVARAS
jgi:ComF family protein